MYIFKSSHGIIVYSYISNTHNCSHIAYNIFINHAYHHIHHYLIHHKKGVNTSFSSIVCFDEDNMDIKLFKKDVQKEFQVSSKNTSFQSLEEIVKTQESS